MSSLAYKINNKHTFCKDAFSFRVIRIVNKGINDKSDSEIISMVKSRKVYCPFVTKFKPGEKRYLLRECPYGHECKGAHSKEEIVLEDKYKNFLNYKMKKLDLVKFYHIMLNLIRKNKKSIFSDLNKFEFKKILKEKEIVMDKDRIINLDESNFISVLHLWKDMAFVYGIIKKNLTLKSKWKGKNKPIPTCGYTFKRDIPDLSFDLPIEEEDLMWALNKYSRSCSKHKRVLDNLRNSKKFSLNECCGGDINCKFGSHYDNESICIQDLISGDCNCKNKNYKIELDSLNDKLKDCDDSERRKLMERIKELKNIKLNTKMHLTILGLKPFKIQLDEYNKNKEEKEKNDPSSIHNMIKSLNVNDGSSGVKQIKKIKRIKRIKR